MFKASDAQLRDAMGRIKAHEGRIEHVRGQIVRRKKTLSWHKKKRDGSYSYPEAIARHKKYIGKSKRLLSDMKRDTKRYIDRISPLQREARKHYLCLKRCEPYMYNVNKVRY